MMSTSKVALVTGSGKRRVGNAVARALAERGYSIAVHYHQSADAALETVRQLQALGTDAEAFAADVADEQAVIRLFMQMMERFGRLDALVTAARAIEDAGCFAVVLEGVPDVLATAITAELTIPTIGIGAGPGTDGQVLVFHDLLGMSKGTPAKFVRRYLDLGTQITDAVSAYVADVRAGAFPAAAETYGASSELTEHLEG